MIKLNETQREDLIKEFIETDFEGLKMREIVEMLYNGVSGYKELTDEDIYDIYVNSWGLTEEEYKLKVEGK